MRRGIRVHLLVWTDWLQGREGGNNREKIGGIGAAKESGNMARFSARGFYASDKPKHERKAKEGFICNKKDHWGAKGSGVPPGRESPWKGG